MPANQQNHGNLTREDSLYEQVEEFLKEYPLMYRSPSKLNNIVLEGTFWFRTVIHESESVEDKYKIIVSVPLIFPYDIPSVREIGNRIPNDGRHHVNPDGTLCLGSPLRLLTIIHASPTLMGFAINCLEPYLSAMTIRLQQKKSFAFGELAHGDAGIIVDYAHLFKLKEPTGVASTIRLLGIKKRKANKETCPCGCNRRLGACSFHYRLNRYRMLASRSWFRKIQL